MRLKVSNVCQLLDKSKYPATQTVNGVTFTNNHNGTWTLSGTSTAAYSYYNLFINIPLRQGHIYLNASFGNAPKTYVEIKWINKDGVVQWGVNPYTADENSKCSIGLIKLKGDVDTVVLGPQLFDLTEMYGAGHEPTTVEQFRQDFPNEMYDYSPECWKKFRRLKYVTETKNLLSDIIVRTNSSGVSYDEKSGIFTILSNDKAAVAFSQDVMNFVTPLPAGTVITVSIYCISGRYSAAGDHTAVGGYHKYAGPTDLASWQGVVSLPRNTDLSGKTFTITWTVTRQLDAFWIYVPRQTDIIEEDIRFRAQLELGSTSSPYQPYGYLPLNRGKYIANKEPVQLLDKSTYKNAIYKGITYTPNIEDGTWTITGTGTNFSFATIQSLRIGVDFEVGDKVLLRNSHRDDTTYFVFAPYYDSNDNYLGEKDGAGIFTILNNIVRIPVQLTTRVTGVALNITTQVQVFNLTRMYGKGNEPTAAEFATQYPGFDYPVNKYNAITFR